MLRVPKIALFSAVQAFPSERLLKPLEQLHSVQFVRGEELRTGLYDAALIFGTTREFAIRAARSGLRCMAFLGGDSQPVRSGLADVRLSPNGYLDGSLRGLVLPDRGLRHIRHIEAQPGEQVVAWSGDDALWIHRPEGRSAIDLVAMDPPDAREGEHLFSYFEKENWVRLLPVLHFLREVSGWELPPPRACFMFDDPNLHWKSYGYVQYSQLLDHARQHNYHLAFATVPLDTWYVHPETARLFRNGSARLSLVTHGNNHTLHELATGRTEESRRAVAAQALLRIRQMEEEFGLEVAHVMVAPHEACDHHMADVLKRVGFDAACNSPSPLMAQNSAAMWQMVGGLMPAEFIGDGLPVIRRFNIRSDARNTRFSAFFGRPIVLAGHHGDLADGLGLLEDLAAVINSIPGVQWMGMKAIAETNFSRRREGDTLQVKMFSRRIRVKVPEGVQRVSVQRAWLSENQEEGLTVLRPASDPEKMDCYQGAFLAVTAGGEVVIRSVSPDFIDPDRVTISAPPLWAIARRLLSEGRDRARPITDKLTGRNSRNHA